MFQFFVTDCNRRVLRINGAKRHPILTHYILYSLERSVFITVHYHTDLSASVHRSLTKDKNMVAILIIGVHTVSLYAQHKIILRFTPMKV